MAFRLQEPQTSAAYIRVRPFVEAMFLVMTADGAIDEAEREVLRGAVRILSAGQLGTAATDFLFAELEDVLKRDGLDTRLDSVASEVWSEPDDRELAVALVAAMAASDQHVTDAERSTINALVERLGIAREAAQIFGAPSRVVGATAS